MNEHGSNSVLKIYPNPEEVPDKPYFTKEIFLNMCLSDAKNLAVTRGLLSFNQIDHQVTVSYTHLTLPTTERV